MSCIATLDDLQGQFFPGNEIAGKVVCAFTNPKNVREIRVELRGKEQTNWTGTETYYDNCNIRAKTRSAEYHGDNHFYTADVVLRGSGEVQPGCLEYSFKFVLPKNIPGSYEGKYGSISYSVKAIVDILFSTGFEDIKQFTVVAPIDFNEIKDRLQLNPVTYSDYKQMCYCFCIRGPITMDVHLEKKAYVPGETLKIKVDITNKSFDTVERVEAKLSMAVDASAKWPKREMKRDFQVLASDCDTNTGAHSNRTYEFQLEIPRSTVVPNFNKCTLFKLRAQLTVKAIIPYSKSMLVCADIDMGHIPIEGQNKTPRQCINPPQQNNQLPPTGVPDPSTITDTCEKKSSLLPSVQKTPHPPSVQPTVHTSQTLPANPSTAPSPSSGSEDFAVLQPTTKPPSTGPNSSAGGLPAVPEPDRTPQTLESRLAVPMDDKLPAPTKAVKTPTPSKTGKAPALPRANKSPAPAKPAKALALKKAEEATITPESDISRRSSRSAVSKSESGESADFVMVDDNGVASVPSY